MARHDEGPVRGHIRRKGMRRVSHGLFRTDRDGLDEDERFLRDLEAWLLVLPDGAVFTHVTAARLLGWQLPALPDQVPVFAAVRGTSRHPRRPGLICSRFVARTGETPETGKAGRKPPMTRLPVDTPEEVLLRAARDLGTLDLTILLDSARRCGHVDDRAMQEILTSGRPGTRNLRKAWQLSSPASHSAGDTVLRLFHEAIEVRVEPAVRVHLLVSGTSRVHEYACAGTRGTEPHGADTPPEGRLVRTEAQRSPFTLDDLLNHPGASMHDIDRFLGRTHVLDRLRRWRQLVAGSLYDDAARQRILNRWQRSMGVTDWSMRA